MILFYNLSLWAENLTALSERPRAAHGFQCSPVTEWDVLQSVMSVFNLQCSSHLGLLLCRVA